MPPSRVILASPEDDDALKAHLGSGGLAVFVRGKEVVLGNGTRPALVLGPAPGSLPGREVLHVLAAIAAAWPLGQSAEKTDGYLRSLS